MRSLVIVLAMLAAACGAATPHPTHRLGAEEMNVRAPLTPSLGLQAISVGGGNVTPTAGVCRGFMVGGAGNVAVDTVDGSTNVLITAPAIGVIHWIAVTKFYQTGTTATGILCVL